MASELSKDIQIDRDFWNDSYKGEYLWSNVNFGEAVTDIMTPLTWSVIRFTLDDWVFLPGWSTVGVIGGRPYLNISIFATLFDSIGKSRQDLLSYMESTLYMRLPEDLLIPTIPIPRLRLFQGMLFSLQVQLKQRRGIRRTPAYLGSNKEWLRNIRQVIQAQKTAAGLLDLWHRDLKAHIKNGVWCVLGSVSHSTEYTLNLRRQLEKQVGSEDANILIANLGDRDDPLESMGPLVGLAKLARGEISMSTYLEDYGHRGPDEFELSVPRPAEDPTWLESELEKMEHSPIDIENMIALQRESFKAAWKRLEASSPGEMGRFKRQIAESVNRARVRELTRSAYIRDRWAVRLFAVRAGQLTGLGDQVFYLTLRELLSLLAGNQTVTQFIEPRMAAYQRYKSLPAYPSVILGRFDPFTWAADPDRATDIYNANGRKTLTHDPDCLLGSPGSAGVVEGFVRIVHDPDARDSLQQGEIMVAVQTDIAWTLLFPHAGAVITDIGAPLSHAAIVARELGIPAVVGCGNATAALRTGDRVRVDGANGCVEILDRRS